MTSDIEKGAVLFKSIKRRFAAISLNKGFITHSQVIEALTIQLKENIGHKHHRPIGEIFMDLGFMNKAQIDDVLQTSFEPRFGDIAISKAFITIDQLVEAMTQQVKEDAERQPHRLIGEILVAMGHMTQHQVTKTLEILKDN